MTAPRISTFFLWYGATCISVCLAALLLAVKERRQLLQEWCRYGWFLAVPWKLSLFGVALVFVTAAGRFTNDETWDSVTGSAMSLLTFLSAPWSIGVAYQVFSGRRRPHDLLLAVALLLLSTSWFYDGYLLMRDGAYSPRWAGNLMLSPIIYVAAGVLWNLEAHDRGGPQGDGFRLSFTRPDWPGRPEDERFSPLIVPALPLVIIAAFVLVAFVGWRFNLLGWITSY